MSQSSIDSITLPQFEEKLPPVIEKIHFVQPETGKVRLSVSPNVLNNSMIKPLVFVEPLAIAVQMYDRVKSDYARCNVPYALLKKNKKYFLRLTWMRYVSLEIITVPCTT